MNILANILPFFLKEIDNFSRKEIISFAYLSIEKILRFSKSDCILNSYYILSDEDISSFQIKKVDIKKNIPLHYVL